MIAFFWLVILLAPFVNELPPASVTHRFGEPFSLPERLTATTDEVSSGIGASFPQFAHTPSLRDASHPANPPHQK